MIVFYNKSTLTEDVIELDLQSPSILEELEKTHYALDLAYAGFNNAIDIELIDSYIYEINSLIKRHNYLSKLAGTNTYTIPAELNSESSVQSCASHVFG